MMEIPTLEMAALLPVPSKQVTIALELPLPALLIAETLL